MQAVEGLRPDVQFIQLPYAGNREQLPVILQYRDSPAVFLADVYGPYYDVGEIGEHFEIVPEGLVFRLLPR